MAIAMHNNSYYYDYQSIVAKWYRTVDFGILLSCLGLIFLGSVLIASGGGIVANRIGISGNTLSAEWWFFFKHIIFVISAIFVMIGVSFLDIRTMRRLGVILFSASLPLLFLTLFVGDTIKGSQRWILGIQPSEFIKPSLIILSAWLMSLPKTKTYISGVVLSLIPVSLVAVILSSQPDVGQTVLICSAWAIMFFVAGGHILWIPIIGGIGISGLFIAYHNFDHVKKRVDEHILSVSEGIYDKYGVGRQPYMAKNSFLNGGFTGRGLGEGEIKQKLSDVHTDYIFALVGEELGVIFCWSIILIYTVIIIRGLWRILQSQDKFTMIAGSGLLSLLGVQSFIHISVNLGLLPSKGMTLPFISYGGSSTLALGFLVGFVLCLTRKRPYGYRV